MLVMVIMMIVIIVVVVVVVSAAAAAVVVMTVTDMHTLVHERRFVHMQATAQRRSEADRQANKQADFQDITGRNTL